MGIRRRTLLLGAALLLPISAAGTRAYAETTPVVIAVGVNSSFDPALAPLSYAETDAERFAYTMATVGGVNPYNVTLLRNPTAAEFVAAVRHQTKVPTGNPAAAGAKALRVILYFSGHADERGLHFRGGALSRTRLHEMLAGLDAATKVLLIDSCFSGSIAAKGVTPDAPFDLPKLDLDELTGSVFLTASAPGEAAYESEELSGGLFTHDVIAGLNGAADANGDGLVTVDELYQYVYRETRLRSLTYGGGGTQHPEYHADLHGHGALVLSTPRQSLGTLRVDPGIIGKVQLASVSGLGTFAVSGQPSAPQEFKLPEGSYRAVIRRGDMIGEASLLIARAETSELRAGQFTWNSADMTLPRAAKGSSAVQASAMYMVAVREAMGRGALDSVVAETDRELVTVATARSRLTVVGSAAAEQGTGSLDGTTYSENGVGLAFGLLLARSDLAVRGVMGFGVRSEWQHWQTGTDGTNRTANNESVYAGILLPIGGAGTGNWSLAARRELCSVKDVDGFGHIVDQYLIGLVVEP